MLVKMRETRQAAPDGIHVVTLEAGETYDLPDSLANSYLDRKLAAAATPARTRTRRGKSDSEPADSGDQGDDAGSNE